VIRGRSLGDPWSILGQNLVPFLTSILVPFLRILQFRTPNCRLFNACLTEMRSRAPSPWTCFGPYFCPPFWAPLLTSVPSACLRCTLVLCLFVQGR
jgi:hypothetical protein